MVHLNAHIHNKIAKPGPGVNVGYWEALLELLNPYMARQRLKELHSQMLKIRLKHIREEQSREMIKFDNDNNPGPSKIIPKEIKPRPEQVEFKKIFL